MTTNYPSPIFSDVHTSTIEVSGEASVGNLAATGAVSAASVTTTGEVSAANMAATGAINAASLTATGEVSGGSAVITGAASMGSLTVGGNPVTGASFASPNRLVNGDMRIAQRYITSGNAINGYLADRWLFFTNVSTTVVNMFFGQNLDGASLVAGFPFYGRLRSAATAYTLAVGDHYVITQVMEGDDISDFLFGTPSAEALTLSFWARCSVAGTFSGSLSNGARTRSYPFSFTLSANAWTKVSVTIPGDTGGTWNSSGNQPGMLVNFCFAAGATYLGAANTWAASNYVGTTGATPLISSGGVAASFDLTAVKLEVGSTATAYIKVPMQEALAACQRNYTKTYNPTVIPGTASQFGGRSVYAGPTADTAATIVVNWDFPVSMRDVPQVSVYSPNSGIGGNAYALNAAHDVVIGLVQANTSGAFAATVNTTSLAAHEIVEYQLTADAEFTGSPAVF